MRHADVWVIKDVCFTSQTLHFMKALLFPASCVPVVLQFDPNTASGRPTFTSPTEAHASIGPSRVSVLHKTFALHEAPTFPADCVPVVLQFEPSSKVERGHGS